MSTYCGHGIKLHCESVGLGDDGLPSSYAARRWLLVRYNLYFLVLFCYDISIDYAAWGSMEYSKSTKANFPEAKLTVRELESRIPHCFHKAETQQLKLNRVTKKSLQSHM